MNRYTVLWLEDEPKKNHLFFDRAEFDGIDLIQVGTVKDFKEEFDDKVKMLDAIILDAKGVVDSLEENPSLLALKKALTIIHENNYNKKLPYFIMSGYLGEDENRSAREFLDDEDIYTKSEDEEELILDLKRKADLQDHTQIKHNNSTFFNAIKGYDIEVHNLFIDILTSMKGATNGINDKLYFTQIRIVLEEMFRKANKAGLLHDNCIQKGIVNLTDASRFLSGIPTKHSGSVKASESYFSKLISDAVQNILYITGAASHTTDPEYERNINIHEYRKAINTPYLLYSLTLQLMDILIWFEEYLKLHPDPKENKKFWEQLNSIEGKLISTKENGWGIFQPVDGSDNIDIPKYLMKTHGITDNDLLVIETKLEGEKTLVFNPVKIVAENE
ncbi:hypothetical protein LB450_08605 [Psychroflexus sp. CAK1W]|uniref:hypothetical protein n=1 Tax=Psychroflexus curvus TaxID=2873595 RepID=UPI001CCE4F4A|nr:hypothetical protein [Psychroflexus curvus]MBZ9628156.1 hypothetical protein [Psychroflexus curvus]